MALGGGMIGAYRLVPSPTLGLVCFLICRFMILNLGVNVLPDGQGQNDFFSSDRKINSAVDTPLAWLFP